MDEREEILLRRRDGINWRLRQFGVRRRRSNRRIAHYRQGNGGIHSRRTRKPATPRNVEGNDGYYSKCNYYTAKPGKILIIRIYQAASGVDPQAALEMVAESTGAMTTISGLGERARMSSGTESGLPSHVVMLYVVKGNALITVGLAGLDDDTLAGQKAKSAAQKILADL